MENQSKPDIGTGVGRSMGLFGATSVGVGAIVGGGYSLWRERLLP
jgi:hypothetical protein